MTVVYTGHGVTLNHGDVVADRVLAEIDDASVHAVVTDPPYGIGFMGSEWDQPGTFGSQKRNGRPGVHQRRTRVDHTTTRVNGVWHPTVKPLTLMRWLVRLITPPGGVVLDPFAGSGTTVEACLLEGMGCVAVERDAKYLPLIEARITRQRDPVAHVRLVGDEHPTLFDEDAS